MFTSYAIVGFFFRILNFTILVVVGAYLFKKYGRPMFVDLIAKKDAERESLLHEHHVCEEKQATLDALVKHEVALCERFKEKIDIWKKVATTKHQICQNKIEERIATIAKRNVQCADQRECKRVQKIVIDRLVETLQKKLTDHFEQANVGSHYIDSITHFMDEGLR